MKENEIEDINLKGTPFEVPERYFDTFEDRIHSRMNDNETQSTPTGVFKTALCLAAAFAVVFGIGYGTLHLTGTADYNLKSGDLSAETQEKDGFEHTDFILNDNIGVIDDIEDEEIVTFLTTSLTSSDISYYSELL